MWSKKGLNSCCHGLIGCNGSRNMFHKVMSRVLHAPLATRQLICHLTSSPAPPSTPTITSLISTYSDQLTVTWTSVLTATSYNVNINDSVNTLVPVPSTGAPQYTFTGLINNTVYTVSMVAINCAESSSPATISGRTISHMFTQTDSRHY